MRHDFHSLNCIWLDPQLRNVFMYPPWIRNCSCSFVTLDFTFWTLMSQTNDNYKKSSATVSTLSLWQHLSPGRKWRWQKNKGLKALWWQLATCAGLFGIIMLSGCSLSLCACLCMHMQVFEVWFTRNHRLWSPHMQLFNKQKVVLFLSPATVWY